MAWLGLIVYMRREVVHGTISKAAGSVIDCRGPCDAVRRVSISASGARISHYRARDHSGLGLDGSKYNTDQLRRCEHAWRRVPQDLLAVVKCACCRIPTNIAVQPVAISSIRVMVAKPAHGPPYRALKSANSPLRSCHHLNAFCRSKCTHIHESPKAMLDSCPECQPSSELRVSVSHHPYHRAIVSSRTLVAV